MKTMDPVVLWQCATLAAIALVAMCWLLDRYFFVRDRRAVLAAYERQAASLRGERLAAQRAAEQAKHELRDALRREGRLRAQLTEAMKRAVDAAP